MVAKTAPLPVLRALAQPSLRRISMNIAQLLHKLWVIPNVEIVVPLLPEMLFPTQAKIGLEWATHFWKQTPRYSLLRRLQSIGQRIFFRFAQQEVNMLRHDHVPVNAKPCNYAAPVLGGTRMFVCLRPW